MSQYLKVQGNENLVRDMSSGAILNVDSTAREKYMAQKAAAQRKHAESLKQAEEINNLKNEIGEIKQMLLALLNK